jgi:hypothetical protein
VRRREFVVLLGGAGTFPLRVAAQTARARQIAVLMAYREGDPEGRNRVDAFREGLREAGWVDGRNEFPGFSSIWSVILGLAPSFSVEAVPLHSHHGPEITLRSRTLGPP